MDSVLGAELLKTRKRWLPYGLFAFAVVGVLIITLVGGYIEWDQSSDSDPYASATAYHAFVFPYSVAALVDSGQYWGSMFVGILAASVVATEYRWGTVRQALIRGQRRMDYLAIKIVAISIASCVILLTALALGLVISLYTTNVANGQITLDVPGEPSAIDLGLIVLRGAWGIIPYGMLAVMLAVVSRSSVTAVTGIIIFLFGEAVVIALLDSLGGPGTFLQDISIGENVKVLIAENKIGLSEYNSMALRAQLNPVDAPDANVAALILAVHTAVYAGVAFLFFGRRDVTA